MNLIRQIQKRILTGKSNINVEEILRNREKLCIICRQICEKDNKVKKGFGVFCKGCGLAGFAIMGEYPVTGDFNYMHYFW